MPLSTVLAASVVRAIVGTAAPPPGVSAARQDTRAAKPALPSDALRIGDTDGHVDRIRLTGQAEAGSSKGS
jgi:hypothetical protein